MALAAGARLGPYEIQSLIGAGGMGEVYRARDSRLDRTVALKVLPEQLASDPERRTRFEREARAIAALNHPHICTVHDVGQQDGTTYLVMEHLDGTSLATRLRRGRLPLAAVLEIGAQIADALAAAHKAGIIHRDLKPANVMLVGGGAHRARTGAPVTVKLLDFGLAKWSGHGEAPAVMAEGGATETATLTARGTILGTLPYMAPEQVQGLSADARTDIWAVGAILFEMVTGRRAFDAPSATSLIGAILEREPSALATCEPLVPPALGRLVHKCLAKHPDDRWDSAHDLADELRWIAATATQVVPGGSRPTSWRRTALRVVLPSLAIGGVVVGLAVWAVRPSVPTTTVWTRVNVQPADEVDTIGRPKPAALVATPGGSRTAFTWTPDGRSLLFVGYGNGTRQIYLRDLASPRARIVAGSSGAFSVAVSPDGQNLVFFAGGAAEFGRTRLGRVPLAGGPFQTLASDVPSPLAGVAVGVTGLVVFSSGGRIWRVASDAAPFPVTSLAKGETAHFLPQLLANDTVLLFTVKTSGSTWGRERLVAQVLATGERKTLLQDAVDARYVPSGHLLFLRRGLLMAVPFDVGRLAVMGQPVAVLEGVAQALTGANTDFITGAGQFAVSSTGALAYVPSAVIPFAESALVSVDRLGRVSPIPGEVRSYGPGVRVSPDGRRLAVSILTLTEEALWMVDLTRGSLMKLTSGGEAGGPRWTPDAQRVVFGWFRDGVSQLAWQAADGSTPPETLVAGDFAPSSWSPDGRHLAAWKDGDIWTVTVGSGRPTLTRITETPAAESHPEFSPDGRWLAYTSDTTGRSEVYVRPYPGPGPALPVTISGGDNPAWDPQGGELFYFERVPGLNKANPWGLRMMSVIVREGRAGQPRRLFDFTGDLGLGCHPVRCYDVTPDGQRLIAIRPVTQGQPPPVTDINVVLNWVEELKAKVPRKYQQGDDAEP